jgi:hypothetical protein
MNVLSRLHRIQDALPGHHNGTGSQAADRKVVSMPPPDLKGALLLAIPLTMAAAGIVQLRRGMAAEGRAPAEGKAARARHRPRSFVRYYGLGLLINALERDATRKAVITVLKLMQKRA